MLSIPIHYGGPPPQYDGWTTGLAMAERIIVEERIGGLVCETDGF